MNRGAQVSLLRWLRRQLQQPTPTREHLEAAVENDDPSEVRRLLADMPFTDANAARRGHARRLGRRPLGPGAVLEQQLLDALVAVLACRVDRA